MRNEKRVGALNWKALCWAAHQPLTVLKDIPSGVKGYVAGYRAAQREAKRGEK